MAQCLTGLGSNLDDREAALRAAWRGIGQFPATRCLRLSRLFTTQPVGGPAGQEPFSNAVGLIETSLHPEELLQRLLQLEDTLGRVRHQRWGPRAIDLDLLAYDQQEIRTPSLIVPHPRMAFRRFVLEPAAEVAPDFAVPPNGWSIRQLLTHLGTAPQLIAMAAIDQSVLEAALREIAARTTDVRSVESAEAANRVADGGWTILHNWPAAADNASDSSRAGSAQPRLVVVVDSAADQSPAAAARRQDWRTLMRQPTTDPVLWLSTSDPSAIAEEVVAAMAAMR